MSTVSLVSVNLQTERANAPMCLSFATLPTSGKPFAAIPCRQQETSHARTQACFRASSRKLSSFDMSQQLIFRAKKVLTSIMTACLIVSFR